MAHEAPEHFSSFQPDQQNNWQAAEAANAYTKGAEVKLAQADNSSTRTEVVDGKVIVIQICPPGVAAGIPSGDRVNGGYGHNLAPYTSTYGRQIKAPGSL